MSIRLAAQGATVRAAIESRFPQSAPKARSISPLRARPANARPSLAALTLSASTPQETPQKTSQETPSGARAKGRAAPASARAPGRAPAAAPVAEREAFEDRAARAQIVAEPALGMSGQLLGWLPSSRFAFLTGGLEARSLRAAQGRSTPLATPALALAAAASRLLAELQTALAPSGVAQAAGPAAGEERSESQRDAHRRLVDWATERERHHRAAASAQNDGARAGAAAPRGPLDGIGFIDVFAGAGGFHLGLAALGAHCAVACEIDEAARSTYSMNFGSGFPFHRDARELAKARLPVGGILCAGFPCQPFSQAGNGEGFDDAGKGDLFFCLMEIARAAQPALMLLENVPAFAGHAGGQTMDRALDAIEALGYEVHARKLDAGRFGVAQRRERLFFVAARADLAQSARDEARRPFLWPEGHDDSKVVADVLEPAANEPALDASFRFDRPEPAARSREIERVGLVDGRKAQGYRIYSTLGKAATLCADSGGKGAQTGLYRVDGQVRRLTPRECARLAGFGDDFKLPANPRDARRQFGNCVVAPVIEAIAREAARAYL